jgi:hypothetical protein
MPAWYKPKELTDSLELDYVHRPRAFQRWQRRCLWAVGGLALLYVGWILWPSHHTALEAGPVSTPHAMFNQDCTRCHTERFATAGRLVPGSHAMSSTPDAACLQCHPGPAHNPSVKAENCAACHKEHRGIKLLSRPGDPHCTACHANLKAQYGSACKFENVASFAAHPEFALWRDNKPTDSGNVEFNHFKHLRLRKEDKVNAAEVARLQELRCGYCHQPDAAGKYMQPIQYDRHCQACHPLLVPADKMTVVPEALQPALRFLHQEPVPHPKKGQTVWQVRAAVRERYLQFAQRYGALLKLDVVPEDQWKLLPGLARPVQPATQSQIDWVNVQWKHAEELLFDRGAGCARCHQDLLKKHVSADGLPQMSQPAIPSRWLTHSVFDHRAHKALACTSCHEGALTSTRHQDVLMPRLGHCQTCHQTGKGFARADCAECHLFHHRGDGPAWQGKMSIDDCTGRPGKQ